MKVAAHPLMVAVALGLLAPVALEELEESQARAATELRRAPDAQEQARAERLWRQVSQSFEDEQT